MPIDAGSKKSVTLSIDVMSASARVILAAAKAERAEMVADAFSPAMEKYSSPSGMIQSVDTTWFVDQESVAVHDKRAGRKKMQK